LAENTIGRDRFCEIYLDAIRPQKHDDPEKAKLFLNYALDTRNSVGKLFTKRSFGFVFFKNESVSEKKIVAEIENFNSDLSSSSSSRVKL
jgi:hypothetical protein